MDSKIERIGERDVRGTKVKVITHGNRALATEQALVRQNSSVSGLRGIEVQLLHCLIDALLRL